MIRCYFSRELNVTREAKISIAKDREKVLYLFQGNADHFQHQPPSPAAQIWPEAQIIAGEQLKQHCLSA
jgi:hypothetical protein